MNTKEYRVALIKFDNYNRKYSYLCDDLNINVGDMVYLEGQENSYEVFDIIYVTKDTSPYPLDLMKKVLSKVDSEELLFDEDEYERLFDDEEEIELDDEDDYEREFDVEDDNQDIKSVGNESLPNESNLNERINLDNGVQIKVKLKSSFSYIDYHADFFSRIDAKTMTSPYSFIDSIKIINQSESIYKDLVLNISFSNNNFEMNNIEIKDLFDAEALTLKIPYLRVNFDYIQSVEEIETETIIFELIEKETNKIIAVSEYGFAVLPISQPSEYIREDYRLYAKYVTPLISGVKQITLNAAANFNGPLIAYQNSGSNQVNKMLEEAQAIYNALHQWGIVYQNPPAGSLTTQRVRMPEEVLLDKKGTCLDLSILYCACLAEVGYHSILVLIDGHAFAGFFLDEKIGFKDKIEFNCGNVYNIATVGIEKLVLVECTTFCAANKTSFQEARELGLKNIRKYSGSSFAAIDIYRCHESIFKPIPTKETKEDLDLLIDPVDQDDIEINPIESREFDSVLREAKKDRFTIWERKLLDLNEKNPLVKLRLKTSHCVKMTSDKNLYELLANNESLKFEILPLEKQKINTRIVEEEFLRGTLKPSKILGKDVNPDLLLAIGFEKDLKNIIKKSNSAMEETGSGTLFICLGILTYKSKTGNSRANAPFLILPIKITKDKLGSCYTMTYDYDDIMINETFFEYYKQEHPGVDFGDLYQIKATDKYLDIVHTFKTNNSEDISLDEDSFIVTNLTFAHYIMWQDVRKRKNELRKNKVIQSILENRNVLEDGVKEINKNAADVLEQYHNFAAPTPYDSTQLKAILTCGEGKSFILDGPPGTGKSQTIVNMIVNAFYHGKTVLFVAEKKAALDVVAERLKKLGDPNSNNNLGRFCLELHSNKANKADFFNKLKTSMEFGPTKNPENFLDKCRELELKRDNLLKVINKMHIKKYNNSLYESIVKLQELEEYNFESMFNEEYLLSLTNEKKNETIKLIDEYISKAEGIADYNINPLKVIKAKDLNFSDKDEIIDDFKNTLQKLTNFLNSYKEVISELDYEFDLNQTNIITIMSLLNLTLNKTLYINELSEYILNTNDDDSIKVFNKTKELLELLNKYNDIINFNEASNINAHLAIKEITVNYGFFKRLFVNARLKKQLKKVVNPEYKIKNNNLLELYQSIEQYQGLFRFIKENSSNISKFIDLDYFKNYDKVYEIEENYFNTRSFINNIYIFSNSKDFKNISNLFINVYSTKNPVLKLMYSTCDNLLQIYKEIEKEICDKYLIDYKKYTDKQNDLYQYRDLLDYAINEDNFSDLISMCGINIIHDKLTVLGLSNILDGIISSQVDYKNFREIYELLCAKGYIKLYFKDDDINLFNPSSFDAEVKKYKNLIKEYNETVIEYVSAKLTKELTEGSIEYQKSSSKGILKKLISSNGRGVSIRDTLLNHDETIRKYFPCFLMSPLSAAQYLAVDTVNGKSVSKFDIVIFDEASQIPTHEAIGPIARGKSLIVAGDPEQMPPSAYFSAGIELAEDEIDFIDADSLLDECISIDLPRIQLAYHYRSKHESLISFSNKNFYNNNLYTFPSSNTASSFVEFVPIEIDKNKYHSNITDTEINAVCNAFRNIYTDEKTKNKSVGIIVFNMTQQEKVFDAITDMLSQDKQLNEVVEAAAEKTLEPWFVKSLENVQGDERDIIILLICFSKNSSGKAQINGPITRVNGQKRLNVAVSRSKEKMIVLSTLKYTDFDEDKKINTKGKLLLKHFLRYAQTQEFKPCDNANNNNISIIDFIKRDLEDLGYEVQKNVGNSEFRVDLAILSKDKTNYDLGILIDSKLLGGNISCRDKLYVQESVLNSLKWKIINIYSIEYFKDKKRTIQKIIDSIDIPFKKEEYKLEVNIEKAPNGEFHYNMEKYKYNYKKPYVSYSTEGGYSGSMKMLLNEIVNNEGPVSLDIIRNRVKKACRMNVMGPSAKSRLDNRLFYERFVVTYENGQKFYWPNGSKTSMSTFRECHDRTIHDICKEEIAAAMLQVIQIQGDLTDEDLFRAVLDAFEFDHVILNKTNKARLEYVYDWAKKNNIL